MRTLGSLLGQIGAMLLLAYGATFKDWIMIASASAMLITFSLWEIAEAIRNRRG